MRLCAAGRSGTAYSLLTREELPYLLDLHLFLSRPVRAAPEQTLSAAAVAAERLDTGASIYGSFPQVGFIACILRCECMFTLMQGRFVLLFVQVWLLGCHGDRCHGFWRTHGIQLEAATAATPHTSALVMMLI